MKRHVVQQNLKLVGSHYTGPPHFAIPELPILYRQLMGNALFDLWALSTRCCTKKQLVSEPIALDELRQGGVLLSAHLVGFEWLGLRLRQEGIPIQATALSLGSHWADTLHKWLRRPLKGTTANTHSHTRVGMSGRAILSHLDQGGVFGLMADQDFRPIDSSSALRHNFLGIPTLVNPLPIWILRHRPHTPIFFAYVEQARHAQILHVQRCHLGSMHNLLTEDANLDSLEFALWKRYHEWLEGLILRNPGQWYGWLHKRWKSTQPTTYNRLHNL